MEDPKKFVRSKYVKILYELSDLRIERAGVNEKKKKLIGNAIKIIKKHVDDLYYDGDDKEILEFSSDVDSNDYESEWDSTYEDSNGDYESDNELDK